MAKTDDIRKAVKEIILQENSGVQIEDEEDYHAEFSDIGVDSLDLLMATLKITEVYGVEFSEETFDEIRNIQDIVNLIESNA
jgi:acyl carrier protein